MVIIEKDHSCPNVSAAQSQGALLFFGDGRHAEMHKLARTAYASRVIVQTAKDGDDLAIADVARQTIHHSMRSGATNRIVPVTVVLNSSPLCRDLELNDLRRPTGVVQPAYVSLPSLTARALVNDRRFREAIKVDQPHVLLIADFGMSETLEELASAMEQECQGVVRKKMLVSVVDATAMEDVAEAMAERPYLSAWLDVKAFNLNWIVEGFRESEAVRMVLERGPIHVGAVLGKDSEVTLQYCTELRKRLWQLRQQKESIPIFLLLESAVTEAITGERDGTQLIPFDIANHVFTLENMEQDDLTTTLARRMWEILQERRSETPGILNRVLSFVTGRGRRRDSPWTTLKSSQQIEWINLADRFVQLLEQSAGLRVDRRQHTRSYLDAKLNHSVCQRLLKDVQNHKLAPTGLASGQLDIVVEAWPRVLLEQGFEVQLEDGRPISG
jgi:hypothetical protein